MKTLKLISMFALSAALLSASYGSAPASTGSLTLVTSVEGKVTLFAFAGSGDAIIDWGDGSAPQIVTLEALTFFDDGDMMHDRHRVPHTYAAGSGVKTVTITGDITALDTFDIYPSSIDASGMEGLELLHSYSSELASLDIDEVRKAKSNGTLTKKVMKAPTNRQV
jgi:hypothetical protein